MTWHSSGRQDRERAFQEKGSKPHHGRKTANYVARTQSLLAEVAGYEAEK